MIRLLVKIIGSILILQLLFAGQVHAQNSKCGNWSDVKYDDADYGAFVRVCNFGYFTGNSLGNLRPDDNLTRVEASVILNRIFGVDTDFDFSKDNVGFVDKFFIDNKGKDEFKWIFKAVSNATNLEIGENKVFEGYSDNTFRPLEGIKFVEFAKVILMGLKYSGDANYMNTVFDFSKIPWYADIDNLLLNFGGSSSLGIGTDGLMYTKSTLGSAKFKYDTVLKRRQAIVFIDSLIEGGYLDVNFSYVDNVNGYGFSYPASMINTTTDKTIKLLASDGYTALMGIQRLSAGVYTGVVDPLGYNVSVPVNMQNKIKNVKKFESCDSVTLNCQIAYFFVSFDENRPIYFLEISYNQSAYNNAKMVIDEVYQSYNVL